MKSYIGILAATCVVACGVVAMAGEGAGDKAAKHAEKIGEIKQNREAKHAAKMTEWQTKHDGMVAKVKERLAANTKLTDAEKQDILDFINTQYTENVTFRNTQFDENLKFLDELAGMADLTRDQMKEKIKAHIEAQKAENKKHREEQKGERKAEHEKVKAEHKGAAVENK